MKVFCLQVILSVCVKCNLLRRTSVSSISCLNILQQIEKKHFFSLQSVSVFCSRQTESHTKILLKFAVEKLEMAQIIVLRVLNYFFFFI